MPWKNDGKGGLAVEDGAPVWVGEDGVEKRVDYEATMKRLADVTKESIERKGRLREQEAVLKQLEGIEDVPAFLAKAKKDAETVAGLSEKEKGAEEAARIRVEAALKPKDARIAELEKKLGELTASHRKALVDSQFGTSAYVSGELVNAQFVRELFGRNFSVDEDGKIVGHDQSGNVIYDESGVAGFDSALRRLVAASPYKDLITRGSRASGSGSSPGGAGGGSGGTKTMTRSDFEQLPPLEKQKRVREGYTFTD